MNRFEDLQILKKEIDSLWRSLSDKMLDPTSALPEHVSSYIDSLGGMRICYRNPLEVDAVSLRSLAEILRSNVLLDEEFSGSLSARDILAICHRLLRFIPSTGLNPEDFKNPNPENPSNDLITPVPSQPIHTTDVVCLVPQESIIERANHRSEQYEAAPAVKDPEPYKMSSALLRAFGISEQQETARVESKLPPDHNGKAPNIILSLVVRDEPRAVVLAEKDTKSLEADPSMGQTVQQTFESKASLPESAVGSPGNLNSANISSDENDLTNKIEAELDDIFGLAQNADPEKEVLLQGVGDLVAIKIESVPAIISTENLHGVVKESAPLATSKRLEFWPVSAQQGYPGASAQVKIKLFEDRDSLLAGINSAVTGYLPPNTLTEKIRKLPDDLQPKKPNTAFSYIGHGSMDIVQRTSNISLYQEYKDASMRMLKWFGNDVYSEMPFIEYLLKGKQCLDEMGTCFTTEGSITDTDKAAALASGLAYLAFSSRRFLSSPLGIDMYETACRMRHYLGIKSTALLSSEVELFRQKKFLTDIIADLSAELNANNVLPFCSIFVLDWLKKIQTSLSSPTVDLDIVKDLSKGVNALLMIGNRNFSINNFDRRILALCSSFISMTSDERWF